jgi:hypothetical protein
MRDSSGLRWQGGMGVELKRGAMNRRTARRVKNRAPPKLAKKFSGRVDPLLRLHSRDTTATCSGNVRSPKELADERPPALPPS